MKKIIFSFSLIVFCLLFYSENTVAQTPTDEEYVANWIFGSFPYAAVTVPEAGFQQKQAYAQKVSNDFDPANVFFDTEWASIKNEYPIANVVKATGGADHGGDADFKGSFKAVYNDDALYILLQYTDDDVTGSEEVEIMWAQDEEIAALRGLDEEKHRHAFARYKAFGGYKATFNSTAFVSAMEVYAKEDNTIAINWGSTDALLKENLFVDDLTETGSKTIKRIYTIQYPVLTGEQRPKFDLDIWKTLNDGKGISFDIKVNDKDTDENNPSYWWSSTHNDGYQVTWYSGFLGVSNDAVASILPDNNNNIFGEITKDKVSFNIPADVVIYNTTGAVVVSAKRVMEVNLSRLGSGLYIIKANDEVRKIIR